MLSSHKYTLMGIAAIVLWSCLVALTRNVAEQLGPVGGAAMIYSVASLFLLVVMGVPKLRQFSLSYIVIAGGLFAAYEVCFSLALGYADSRLQTIEMAVINYLWPALTVLFAVWGSSKRVNKLIYPAILLAFSGVVWSLMGGQEVTFTHITENVTGNPLAYSLALIGAIIWAVYCNVTKRLSNGKNGITLFFVFTAISLWFHYLTTEQPPLEFNCQSIGYLLLTGVVMGSGYALWNLAIIGGNMLLLASLSYFTPIFSTLISMLVLGVSLSAGFWQGVILVTFGSLLCWWVTRE
ncbi:aromatic amino acid DMT transporter YddG [Vibrio sp. SCSIO 43137]|uniref:aromatic amino acid DMT transporter YddG n=1 Tax=Vibrio sp. SCSIO 43137 TaxID=3021011 RepID=UPI002306EEC1|nr:aromatic amino acid DMT transporter YddG [Vibrio sp. SCSIO 43137]WCE28667.1 aromatic amino acid DMT transporter YddG [Vibrio sp. SCSIO 43137]